jgi:hypothetical protein
MHACAGPAGALCKAVAEAVRPAAVAAYQEALASVFTSGAVARKRAKEGALAALDEAFQLLQLYQSGCELLQVGGVCLLACAWAACVLCLAIACACVCRCRCMRVGRALWLCDTHTHTQTQTHMCVCARVPPPATAG